MKRYEKIRKYSSCCFKSNSFNSFNSFNTCVVDIYECSRFSEKLLMK